MNEQLAVVVTGLGAIVGGALRAVLAPRRYRLPEETAHPTPSLTWLVPVAAVVSGATWWAVAPGRPLVVPAVYVLATWVMAWLAAVDLDVHRLPDAIQLPAYPVLVVLLGACSGAADDWPAWRRSLLAGVVAFAVFLALALLGPAGAMGFGDVKLAGLVGLLLGWLGWRFVVFGVLGTFLVGGVIGVAMLATRRVERGGEFAYGPAILASTALTVIVLAGPLAR